MSRVSKKFETKELPGCTSFQKERKLPVFGKHSLVRKKKEPLVKSSGNRSPREKQ